MKINRRHFVIGDIHGAHRALMQCLSLANFNYKNDVLICLGDVCDGWPDIPECIDTLREIKNVVMLLGNHDEMALQWAKTGYSPTEWLLQGGKTTQVAYNGLMLPEHVDFLSKGRTYFEWKNKLFVHAGYQPGKKLKKHSIDALIWDRSLTNNAIRCYTEGKAEKLTDFDEVYVGHTPTLRINSLIPVKACDVWLMDTGAGWNGMLSMMDINTKEVFQSECVSSLYPNSKGRY